MDEIPTREIRTIRIENHEFRTYNLTINDGSTRKTLVFISHHLVLILILTLTIKEV